MSEEQARQEATEVGEAGGGAEPAKKLYRANLDHDRVYWGVEEVASLQEGDIPVPHDCDLKLGMYRWNGTTFELLPRQRRKPAPTAPTLEQAFYSFLTEGPESPRVIAWRQWMAQTVDERSKS